MLQQLDAAATATSVQAASQSAPDDDESSTHIKRRRIKQARFATRAGQHLHPSPRRFTAHRALVSAVSLGSAVWRSVPNVAAEYDLACPTVYSRGNMAKFGIMPTANRRVHDPPCQVRCMDSNCSNAWAAAEMLRQTTEHKDVHVVTMHCPLKAGSFVTIKGGENLRAHMPGDTLCERLCNAELSRVAINRR